MFHKVFGIGKIYGSEGGGGEDGWGITTFFQFFFVSQYQKTSQGNLCVLHKMSGIGKILDKSGGEEEGGSITILYQIFFCFIVSIVSKNLVWNFSVFH